MRQIEEYILVSLKTVSLCVTVLWIVVAVDLMIDELLLIFKYVSYSNTCCCVCFLSLISEYLHMSYC